jgi:hypothetical protein
MRNDLETREIADAELDAVSGGLANGAVTISGGLAGAASSDVNSFETVEAAKGLVNTAPALVGGITGVQVNTSAVTGLLGL